MAKDSFIIYSSFYKPISRLSDKQLGRLFRAIFNYNLGEVVSVEEDISMAFEFFKNQFEIDESKRQAKIMRDIENGRKGGNPNLRKNNQGLTKDNPGLTQTRLNENDNENDNEDKKKKQSYGLLKEKPTLSEIESYALSIHSHVNVEDFYNYYEATDWKVQGKPMKNWKLTVQTWTKKDRKDRPWLYEQPNDNIEQGELWQS